MWNLTRTQQLALLLLLCTICPTLLIRALSSSSSHDGPARSRSSARLPSDDGDGPAADLPLPLDNDGDDGLAEASSNDHRGGDEDGTIVTTRPLSERLHEAPSLHCVYPYSGFHPTKPSLPLPYCSHLSETSCCTTTGSTRVVASLLDTFSTSFSANPSLGGSASAATYAGCRAAFETFACGRFCAPQQAGYIDEIEKSYAICAPFCQDLYVACRDVLDAATQRTISSLYANSKRFCESQRPGNYTLVVNPSDLCYKGQRVDASASHSSVSGTGYWLSEHRGENRTGVPNLDYCFDVQLEDLYENDKQRGGDSVVITIADASMPEDRRELQAVDNADGSYSTCFSSDTSATYILDYSINDNDYISFTVAISNASWCPLKTPAGYTPRPTDLSEPCGGSSDASCCPEFSTGSCCDATDTATIKTYVESELAPVFQAYPQCFALQQKLLCGLSCDPRQSEYLRYNGGGGNTSATFYICDSYCEALYDACKNVPIAGSEAPMSSILPTADAFCQAAVPSYMADLSFAATADDGAQTCFNGYVPPDACQSSASDYSNTIAGEQGSLIITSRSVYGGALAHSSGYTWTARLVGATGAVVQGNVTDLKNGTFRVTYVATVSGFYDVEIYLVRTAQAPLHFCQPVEVAVFPSVASPINFLVYGDGLTSGFQGLPAYFTIQSRDQYGNNITDGGERFDLEMIRVKSNEQVQNISYTDNLDGTYSVVYVASMPGAHNLTIYATRDGQQLVGRFSVLILPVDAWRAFGAGLYVGVVGEAANFTLQHYNRITNQNITTPRSPPSEFDFLFRGPGNATVRSVVDNRNGTFSVSWSTLVAGRYRLDITERESEVVVTNSPFFPVINASTFDPAFSTASGDLTDLSACNSSSSMVLITARDRYGNPVGLAGLAFNASFSGPEARVVSLTDNRDGTYTLLFSTIRSGTVNLSIRYGTTEILNSPFALNISVGALVFSPSASSFFGSGLAQNPVCTATREFYIQTSDRCGTLLPAGGLNFSISIQVRTSGGATFNVSSTVVDNLNGTYRISYYPTVAGTYTFAVTDTAGHHLASSPLTAGLFPPGASVAYMTTASGLGLRVGSPSHANTFYVSARDQCGNDQMAPLLDQFDLGFEQHGITFSSDWFSYTVNNASYPYRVDYYAPADGEVHMSVRLVGDNFRHINGSPFTVVFSGVPCSPECGSNGVCISGQCKCREGYSGAGCNATVPAPGLRDIRWNNLGVFIYVIFDAPTDMGAAAMGSLRRGIPNRPDNFDCDLLLQFTSFTVYQLGLDYYCYWESDRVLVAVTGRDEMVLTGELIAIRNNTVRAKWGASAFSNGLRGVLQAAPNPQSPMTRIEAPMFVPSCLAQVNLDSRASLGTSGRNFPVSIWSGYERELLSQGTDSLQLNTASLTLGELFPVSFESVNIHEQYGTTTVQLRPVNAEIPEVRIVGSAYVFTTPDMAVYIKGEATTPCGDQSSDPLSYSWVFMDVPDSAPLLELDSVLASTPQLYIPAGILNVLGTYTLRFTASRNDTLGVPNESFALAYVVVRAWSLNALIAPGDRQVSRLSSLVLDASASLRPGQVVEDVQFAWSCFSEEDPEAPCMNRELLQEYLSTNAARIEIPSSTLNPGVKRSLSLVELTRDDLPTNWMTVNVTVVHHIVPVVHIQPIELGEVNAGDSFVLVGSAESRSEASYEWSVDPQFDSDFTKLVLTDRTSPRLVVRGGALAPGIRYKFKLSATSRDGTGWSTLDVLVNQPPLSGNFDVQIAGENQQLPYVLASFNAPFWEDAALDQPYGYQWFFTTQRGSIPLVVEIVGKRSLMSAYLPRGFSNNIQDLVVRVTDGRGGGYERRTPVPRIGSFSSPLCPSGVDQACQIALVQSLIENQLNVARSRHNLDAILQLYNAIYDILNQQLETKDASLSSQRRDLRGQLFDILTTSFATASTPRGTAAWAFLSLGLTEVPDEVTIALANSILMEMKGLAAIADSHTLKTMAQTLSNLLRASESMNFVNKRATQSGRYMFAVLFDEVTKAIADGLIRSAVPGQHAIEVETTKSAFEMLNIPTPATDGNVYIKSMRVTVDDLASSHYYAGVTLAMPQALADEVGETDAVDVTFSVLAVNPSVTSEASLRVNSAVVGLSIKHGGDLVQASNLSQPISISIPLIVPHYVVADKIGRSPFIVPKADDSDVDAAPYTITECRCSFLSSAYATLYEWAPEPVDPLVSPQPEVTPTKASESRPYMSTDQIVLLVIFSVVCLILLLLILKRVHYNHNKDSLVPTTQEELALWNKERGNDLYHIPHHQQPPASKPIESMVSERDRSSSSRRSESREASRIPRYSDDSDRSERSRSLEEPVPRLHQQRWPERPKPLAFLPRIHGEIFQAAIALAFQVGIPVHVIAFAVAFKVALKVTLRVAFEVAFDLTDAYRYKPQQLQ